MAALSDKALLNKVSPECLNPFYLSYFLHERGYSFARAFAGKSLEEGLQPPRQFAILAPAIIKGTGLSVFFSRTPFHGHEVLASCSVLPPEPWQL